LALAELRRYRVKPAEPEKPPKNPYLAPGKVELREEGLVPAVLGKDGKILLQSPPLPGNLRVRSMSSWQVGRVVAMEENPHCPYALLRQDVPELHCFDWQLQPSIRQALPLPRVFGVAPVLLGQQLELWVLGEQERKQPKTDGDALPSWTDEFRGLPGESALLRFRFDSRELLPVRWAGEELPEAVRKLAGQAEKSLTVAGAQAVPVASFDAVEASQGVPVAITAVLQEKPGGFGESLGKQLFLVARATEEGLSGLRRLPLAILHEAGRREVELDEQAGVLLVPEAALVEDLELLALKEQRLLVYFRLSYAPDGVEKAKAQGFHENLSFLACCTPNACEITPLYAEELSQKMKPLCGTEAWVGVFPALSGFASQSTLAFAAVCRHAQTKESLGPCFALFSWAP